MQYIKSIMTEEVLQHIWQYQIFKKEYKTELKTVEGKKLQILNVGIKNSNQGPDFLQGKVKIDDLEWNGHIEVHLKSSLWKSHEHQNDPNYDNIILHVVLDDDRPVRRKNGELIPCVELKNVISTDFLTNYDNFIHSSTRIPCEHFFSKVNEITKRTMLERVLAERLERKSLLFENWLLQNDNDWEQTAYEVIAYCLGLKINANQCRELAHSVPLKTILKHKDNSNQIEALLFGSAGFLNQNIKDEYFICLKNEFDFLNHKYSLNTHLKLNNWNFHRLRPAAFPTLRIAQLSMFLIKNEFVFSKMKEIQQMNEFKKMFNYDINQYWQIHYNFEKKSTQLHKKIGKSTVDLVLINGVAPLLYLYYKKTNNINLLNKAFYLLESLSNEKNTKIDKLESLFKIKSAYDSQSVLELYDYYCTQKKCLMCSIGAKLL